MRAKHSLLSQTGFSLVEMMVALAIGLLTTLVIMQVFSVFEGQKRATTGSADAQTSGSVALYTIGRDLQMAGFGLNPVEDHNPYNCNPLPTFDDDNNPATARTTLDLSPLIITDGVSDVISIVYGSNTMGGTPATIGALDAVTLAPRLRATIGNNLGCRVNDTVLIVNGAVCTASRVTGPTDIATPAVASAPPNTTDVVLQDAVGIGLGANLACLGTWNRISYRAVNGNLEVNGTPTLAGIVNLQAQYGISAGATSNQVAQWVDADAAPWNVAPLAVAQRNRIKAVRIAVIARNGQFERDEVSTACSSLTAANPTGVCAWAGTAASPAPTVDLNADPDWRHYRYRVFETIIPLRNMVWGRDTLL